MNRLLGSGEFQYNGKTRTVRLYLNLDDNNIEIWLPVSENLQELEKNWLGAKVALVDVHFHLLTGEIVLEHFDDAFITSFGGGSFGVYDSTVARAFALRGEDLGMRRICLTPTQSSIEFAFKPYSPTAPQYELFYQGANSDLGMPVDLELDSIRFRLLGDKDGTAVISEKSLFHREELIRLCLGIRQGGPALLRFALNDHNLTVNMYSRETSGWPPLVGKLRAHKDSTSFLQGLLNFFSSLSPAEWVRWKTATYFYLEGMGASAMETQAITLFTFLEIIDDAHSLTKESISKLLDITLDEADLLDRVRNGLTHQGKALGTALAEAAEVISSFKNPVQNSVFDLQVPTVKRDVAFFLRFLMLLNRLWVKKANYRGQWNDYSEMMKNLSAKR
jgi:hypothetical protein